MARVVQGIILTLLFIGAIYIVVARHPGVGPPGERASRADRQGSLLRAAPILGVVLLTIGGMYMRFFSPIEATSVGVFLTFVVAAWLRALTAQAFREVIL